MPETSKNIWFISKYCRLPGDGEVPARGFSLLRCLSKLGYDCTLFVGKHDYRLGKGADAKSPLFVGKHDYSLGNGADTKSREEFFIDGVRVVELSVLEFSRSKSLKRILSWIHFEWKLFFMATEDLPRPDVVVASIPSLFSILNGFLFRRKFDSKFIFEVRDVWPLVIIENGGFSRYNPFVMGLSLIEWLGYRYSDYIVATMPNLGDHVKNVLGYSRTVTCIPMGVPDELLGSELMPLPEVLKDCFPEDKFIVTYAGGIGIDNALDTFFEVARILRDKDGVVFRVFGQGDLLEQYRSSCADLPNVKFCGVVANNMVQSVLVQSSVLYFATHPTVVVEYGQSLNKIIDYMYSGRPILASHSGYQSMINEAECGFFVPAGDADSLCKEILRLADLPDLELNIIGARGLDWVMQHRRYELLANDYARLFAS